LSSEVKVRISLVILKELIEEGFIHNRHIAMLFNENGINSFEDLEIKNLNFEKLDKGYAMELKQIKSGLFEGEVGASVNNKPPVIKSEHS
jgi:hypothetical protein